MTARSDISMSLNSSLMAAPSTRAITAPLARGRDGEREDGPRLVERAVGRNRPRAAAADLGQEVVGQRGRRRLAARGLRDDRFARAVDDARVYPVGARLRGEPKVFRELGRAQAALFAGLGGERRQGLALRVHPALEGDRRQLRLLPQGLVELRAVAAPDAAHVRHADERQRDGDDDREHQQSSAYAQSLPPQKPSRARQRGLHAPAASVSRKDNLNAKYSNAAAARHKGKHSRRVSVHTVSRARARRVSFGVTLLKGW